MNFIYIAIPYLLIETLYRIDPILYRVAVLDTENKAQLFLRTITSSKKPLAFFAIHVKTLYFRWVPNALASQIASICLSLESLCCDVIIEPCKLIYTPVRPKRISVHVPKFLDQSDPDFGIPFLKNVTHLQHTGCFREWSNWSWTGIKSLENLTHLSLRIYPQEQKESVCAIVMHVLSLCPETLQVCVVLVSGEVESVEEMALGNLDPRIVVGDLCELAPDSPYNGVVVNRPHPHNAKDWGYLPPGEISMWDQATAIVRQRMLYATKRTWFSFSLVIVDSFSPAKALQDIACCGTTPKKPQLQFKYR